MFTGLVEALGRVESAATAADGISRELIITAPFSADLACGESVSVNGVCLTVTSASARAFHVDCTATTLSLTTLGQLQSGDPLNLERSCTPSTRLGGHWVLGHVDTTGTVERITANGSARDVWIAFDPRFDPLVAPMGSVTVDGVSLTIVDKTPGIFHVTVIPHTQKQTNLQFLRQKTAVNLEFDVLGKYILQLLPDSGLTPQTTYLKERTAQGGIFNE
ncbi:MAG: riboflavin synthase [Firmicutes bacterium]|nr:riboflavin synthase [Bacillota bacterium]